MNLQLFDRIYEAAFVPELWAQVLEDIGVTSDSVGGALFLFADGKPPRGRAVERLHDMLAKFLASDTMPFSTGVSRMCSVQPASFVDVDSYMTPEEIENDPVRIEFRAHGIGAHLCTAIPMPSGELAIFVFQRQLHEGGYSQAQVDMFDGIRPHLARASLAAARLGLERAQGTVSTMEIMGLPAAVLSGGGRVLAANSLFEALPSVFLPVAFGGLAIADSEANRLFQEAVVQNRRDLAVRSIPLPAKEGRQALIIHLLPLRRAAHDIFSGADILIAGMALNPSALVPSPNILIGLFDLSPAEAKLAAALARGQSLKQAAAGMGITFSTARTYIESVFRKTGTHQQSQLVALLKSTPAIRETF
ncbi:MAG TPA: LuxR C-terminal-related transcriptional regulator [Rhizomicrobium sp.]|nr:LuxR C-terminal-related transcriptional regulator [Rhizomicrobium sp.]